MDISDTLEPNSDQLDAVDLQSGSRVFTITKVARGKADQPVNITVAEFDRVWRPGKNMRRVLSGCWGKETDAWIGRRVELYCDESVMFGGVAVGGIRISRVSDIKGQQKIPLILTKGKSAVWTVDPLPDAPAAQPVSETDLRIAALTEEWHTAEPSRQAEIRVEVEALREGAAA